MMKIREVSITDILNAREERAARQQRLIEQHHSPLISFTMNIAGPVKNNDWIERAFFEGVKRIEAVLAGRRVQILDSFSVSAFTGCEQLWAVQAEASFLKEWMSMLEEQDDLGRLFDIDVIGSDGAKLSRQCERKCLICGGPVRICSRSRAHSADELFRKTHEIIENHFRQRFILQTAMAAEKSLLYELATTPKPGLVDFENNGAHSDMDRFTFIDSACVLRSFFEICVRIGLENQQQSYEQIFEQIRSAGQQAEAEMFEATANINTHKGALFSLGILCCAAGICFPQKISAENLLSHSSAVASFSLSDFEKLSAQAVHTGGERQYITSGLTGVRGEAASGFPSVKAISLPALEEALTEGKNANDAGIDALLALMAHVADSNVLRRTGESGLRTMQSEAQHTNSMDPAGLREMDRRFIQNNISPGGCADLLAVTWFLHEICK